MQPLRGEKGWRKEEVIDETEGDRETHLGPDWAKINHAKPQRSSAPHHTLDYTV